MQELGDSQDPAGKLAEMRASLEAVVRQMPAGVILLEAPSGKLILSNDEAGRIFGQPPAVPEGAAPHVGWPLFHLDGTPYLPEAMPLSRALAGDLVTAEELRICQPDGTCVAVSVNAGPIRDAHGRQTAAVAVFTDITDRLAAREALAETDRRKDEFLAMLAHELRNPLAAIANALEVMRARGDDPVLARARTAAYRQTQHMARLLDDLLDVARVTRGQIELQQEETRVAEVVESAIETMTPLIESRGQHLSLALPEEALFVLGDPVRLSQVVSNLLSNAAKYTPPQGSIDVSVRHEGEDAVIRVRDSGVGIAPDLLPHVFEVFVQGERAPGRAEGGLGIGLTMVRRLVEMHGGKVEAHSAGVGKGSEFVVRLPLVRAAARAAPHPAQPPAPEGAHRDGRRRILVVDDNPDAADVMAILLEGEGYEVDVAYDGPGALATAARRHPDVALLDIGMPEMDGYEVARRLRQDPSLAGMTLIAITGYGQEEDREAARAAGFDRHLLKPVDPEALREALAELVPA